MTVAISLADRRAVLRDRALLALRHCGVIRARRNSPGYLDLWADDLVDAKDVPGQAMADFSLNERGRAEARRLRPEMAA